MGQLQSHKIRVEGQSEPEDRRGGRPHNLLDSGSKENRGLNEKPESLGPNMIMNLLIFGKRATGSRPD